MVVLFLFCLRYMGNHLVITCYTDQGPARYVLKNNGVIVCYANLISANDHAIEIPISWKKIEDEVLLQVDDILVQLNGEAGYNRTFVFFELKYNNNEYIGYVPGDAPCDIFLLLSQSVFV